EDGIRERTVTGVQTCALPICQNVVIEAATASAELVTISSVGTAGSAGTGVTLTAPLTKAHASGGAFTVYTADPTGDMTKVFGAEIGRASCRERLASRAVGVAV